MSGTDLTLIVTAHSETLMCGPTMASADVAVDAARSAGYTVETIIALDRPTPATKEYFDQTDFDHWERRTFDEGDPTQVRNAVVPGTEGRYIAFLDADDLFSENWLSGALDALTAAEARGERAIARPEVNMVFDGGKYLWQNVDQDSPLFTPYFLYVRNCYDTLCMAPRDAHLQVPYARRDVRNGLSREDWQFAIQTMSRGWRQLVVRDTIIFKRRRDFSLVQESDARETVIRALPEMRIDRIRDLNRTGPVDPED